MLNIKFSIIIPVYNRPGEIRELLDSLTLQTFRDFEVLVIEDGSNIRCDSVVFDFTEKLNIKYYFKPNSGPGLSRNYGIENASGNYYIFFDSDCLAPPDYMQIVNNYLKTDYVHAYGGPDKAHASFSAIQKAINYSMTSLFTTGGIRGGKKQMEKFHPRSFNMGFSREAYAKTGGYSNMRFGEDIDLSIKIFKAGLKTALIEDAYVYHKRRTDFNKFFKQVYNSGIARINLYKRHPESLKLVHTFPALFTIVLLALPLLGLFVSEAFLIPVLIFIAIVLTDSWLRNRSLKVAIFSVVASIVQLTGYGLGFLKATWTRLVLGKDEFHAYTKNFYK